MPPTRARRAPTERGARTRAAIVEAAIPLFASHGYRGAALAAVADAVELTQPGLLHHFPSKERLLMAVLEERDNEARARMHDAWSRGGESALRALGDLVTHNATTPDLVRLFTVLVGEAVSDEHPAHGFFAGRYAELRANIEAAIARGQASGEFRSDVDVPRLAALMLAVMDGLQVQWLLDGAQEMPPGWAVFEEMLLSHLKA